MAEVQREAAEGAGGTATAVAEQEGAGATHAPHPDDVLPRIEEQAQKWIKELSSWLHKGEEYLQQSRTWFEEHPVSRDMAEKVARRVQLDRMTEAAPEALDRVRERAGRMRTEFRPAMRQRMDSIREHPMDAVLLGSAAAMVTAVIIMNRRRE